MRTEGFEIELHHDGSEIFLQEIEGGIRLTLVVRGEVDQVFVRTAPDGKEKMQPMQRVAPERWSAELEVRPPHLKYRFLVMTAQGGWHYGAAGVTRHIPPDSNDFRYLRRAELPGWVPGSVFYQIFPDRFHDGDPGSNVRTGEYDCYGRAVVAKGWDELPDITQGHLEFFGGDLPGIAQKLDYLQELGVSALYLNPIFTAPSSHKYDVADYGNVDPHFGGNQALVELMQELRRRDLRLILDVVPNHVGQRHTWFQQALLDPHGPTAEYFTFHQHPDQYETWEGEGTLPKLNYKSQKLLDEMVAIMAHWLREPYQIDGWRLDVQNMIARQGELQLAHEVGRALRRAVKSVNPQAYLLGENFYDASPHLQGDELDASMNYRGFMMPLLHWLAGRDWPAIMDWPFGDSTGTLGWDMVAQWRAFMAVVPWQVARMQFNLLDSHDTPRIRTMLEEDEARLETAFVALFSFPGTPCVYYGDEVGMVGGRDPLNRAPMRWNRSDWNERARSLVESLAALRRTSSALIRGGFEVLAARADRVVFRRMAVDQAMVVDLARGGCEGLILPQRVGRLRGLLHGEEHHGGLPALGRAGGEIYLEVGGEFDRRKPQ